MRDDNRSEMSEDEDRSVSDLGCATETSSNRSTRNCAGISGIPIEFSPPFPDQVLENVLENVLHFLTSRRDRNAVSLVCKSWYRAEALTRSELFIGNCYAVSPQRATERFRRVRSLVLKGKPRFADFNLMPPDWGAFFSPWVITMAKSYPWLEKLYLKRMSVTDRDLTLLSESFPSFKELVLVCCDGFGTRGLAILARKCRYVIMVFAFLFCLYGQWLE